MFEYLEGCPSCRNYLATYRETLLLVRHAEAIDEAEIPAVPQHLLDAIARARG